MYLETLSPEFWLGLAKVTALLLIGFALTFICKSPQLRVIIWSGILASIIPLFFFASGHTLSFLRVIPQDHAEAETETDTTVTQTGKVQLTTPSETPEEITSLVKEGENPASDLSSSPIAEPSPPPTEVSSPANTSYLPFVYYTGLLLSFLPLAVSYFRLRCLPKSPASGSPLAIWQELQKGNKNPPKLKFTPSPSAPFSSGIFSPMVLIPCESQEWSQSRLKSCLLHEAAHLKNRDPLIRALSSIVRALLWFHPLVWFAHRQLIQAQEQTCDQYALRHGVEPECYAEDLLAAASNSHLTPSEALSMAKWSQIGNRIRYVLHPSALKTISMGQVRTLVGTLLILQLTLVTIGFATEKGEGKPITEHTPPPPPIELISVSGNRAHVLLAEEVSTVELTDFIDELNKKGINEITFVNPEEDRKTLATIMAPQRKKELHKLRDGFKKATAVVQVLPGSSIFNRSNLNQPGALMTRDFMETEFEYIVADQTLAIAAKDFKNDFSTHNDAIAFLKDNIITTSRRGTDFIEISAYHQKADKAVQIANTVADAYLQRRSVAQKQQQEEALAALEQELAGMAEIVEEKRNNVVALAQRYGIPFDKKQPTRPLTEETLFLKIKEKISKLENTHHQIKLDLKTEKDPLKVSVLRTKLESTKNHLATLQEAIGTGASDTIDLSMEQHQYLSASEEYHQAHDLLQEMKILQQETRVLLKMPYPPVHIYEKAR